MAVALTFATTAGLADAALAITGDISYSACISGEIESTLAESGPCIATPSASPSGTVSGLDVAGRAAVSADGRNVYVISGNNDSISRFNRSPSSGALTYKGCISGSLGLASSCAQIGDSTIGGEDSGLDDLAGIAVSPNGRSVYVTAEHDAALTRFERNTTNGILVYRECITGEVAVAKQTSCTQIPSASVDAYGVRSGLAGAIGVVVSPDGRSVYVSARYDAAVARFNAAPGTGALSYAGCISGRTPLSTSCTLIPDATMSGRRSGLDGFSSSVGTYGGPELAASPDGESIYLTAQDDAAIAHFNRSTASGALNYTGCLSGWHETACARIETATPTGSYSGLGFPTSVAVSPDGRSVYVGLPTEVARLKRGGSGSLAWRGCTSGSLELRGVCEIIEGATRFGDRSALDSVRSITVSPEGANVYAAVGDSAAISRFNRVSAGGAIAYADCLGADTRADCGLIDAAVAGGENTGLSFPLSVDVSPDGENVYVSAAGDDAVATFERGDAGAPLLRILDPRRQRSARRIAIEVSCDEPCRIVVRSIGRARSAIAARRLKLKLKKANAELKANETRKLKLKYRGKRSKRLVKKALKRGKRITIRLQATATDAAGNRRKQKFKVKVKR